MTSSKGLVDRISDWLEKHPRVNEIGSIFLILFAVVASFTLGLSLRTVHSYTCFSYVQVDPVKGWLYPSHFLPDCEVGFNDSNLSCSPGTELYSYEYGILSGDNFVPDFKERDYRYGLISSDDIIGEGGK